MIILILPLFLKYIFPGCSILVDKWFFFQHFEGFILLASGLHISLTIESLLPFTYVSLFTLLSILLLPNWWITTFLSRLFLCLIYLVFIKYHECQNVCLFLNWENLLLLSLYNFFLFFLFFEMRRSHMFDCCHQRAPKHVFIIIIIIIIIIILWVFSYFITSYFKFTTQNCCGFRWPPNQGLWLKIWNRGPVSGLVHPQGRSHKSLLWGSPIKCWHQ